MWECDCVLSTAATVWSVTSRTHYSTGRWRYPPNRTPSPIAIPKLLLWHSDWGTYSARRPALCCRWTNCADGCACRRPRMSPSFLQCVSLPANIYMHMAASGVECSPTSESCVCARARTKDIHWNMQRKRERNKNVSQVQAVRSKISVHNKYSRGEEVAKHWNNKIREIVWIDWPNESESHTISVATKVKVLFLLLFENLSISILHSLLLSFGRLRMAFVGRLNGWSMHLGAFFGHTIISQYDQTEHCTVHSIDVFGVMSTSIHIYLWFLLYTDFRVDAALHVFHWHSDITVAHQRQQQNISFQVVCGIDANFWYDQVKAQ